MAPMAVLTLTIENWYFKQSLAMDPGATFFTVIVAHPTTR
jgi:hypothetical protein